uniref:WH2 domain-containing protein n=1 Tax=Caenorhabditis tropicalis TaxID=1561998 RepID=A0A1I7US10_9PELO
MNQIPPEPTSQTSQNTSGAQVHPPEPVSQQLPPVDPKPSNPIPRVQKLQMKLGNQEKDQENSLIRRPPTSKEEVQNK